MRYMARGPILSVLLTTYNRVTFLETTVSLFVAQIISEGLSDQVEIVIGNDASSDGTREYLDGLQLKYPFIKVLHHPVDLGLSGNLEAIMTAARGEYVWPFGDDDLIVGGAVKRVLQVIVHEKPNCIILNTKNILSMDDRNMKYEIAGEDRLGIGEDVAIGNYEAEKEKLFKIENWLYLTNLLSAVVFRKKMFSDWIREAKKYVREENVYLFQAPLLLGIAKEGGLYLVAKPLILHRKNENNWSKSAASILLVNLYDGGEILAVIRKHMPREYPRYQKRFAANIFSTILSAKKGGEDVRKYCIDALRMNYGCYPYNLRFLAILLIPGAILRRLA